MNKFLIIGTVVLIIVGVISAISLFNTDNHKTIVIDKPDSVELEAILEEDILGYGYLWSISENEFSRALLINIHIQGKQIIDTWHDEIVTTNYDGTDSFCINPETRLNSLTITNDTLSITMKFDYISDYFFTVKIINDLDCYSQIKGVIIK